MVGMRVTLPLLRIPPARAPILRYGVAVLSTALALIPTVMLADVSESRLALFGVAVMVSAWYGGWKPGMVATAFALTVGAYFTLVGPHNAATFCNIPRCIEQNVEWVTALLRHMQEKGLTRVEATGVAESTWTEHVQEVSQRLLFTQINSWMTGINTNISGKQKRTVLVYAGGAPAYRKRCDEVAAKGYEGFAFQ